MSDVPLERVREYLVRHHVSGGPVEVGAALRSLGHLASEGVVRATVDELRRESVGAGPLELVMLALMDRGIGIRAARWGIELTLLALGLALGGAAGFGTAVFALGTGPVLAITLPRAAARLGTQLSEPTDVAAAGI